MMFVVVYRQENSVVSGLIHTNEPDEGEETAILKKRQSVVGRTLQTNSYQKFKTRLRTATATRVNIQTNATNVSREQTWPICYGLAPRRRLHSRAKSLRRSNGRPCSSAPTRRIKSGPPSWPTALQSPTALGRRLGQPAPPNKVIYLSLSSSASKKSGHTKRFKL